MKITRYMRAAGACALLSAMALAPSEMNAQTHRGEKSFGPRAGYVSRNESGLAGLVFQYSFSEHVRIAPSVDIIFRHRDKDGFAVNADMHFPFAFASGRAAFYPLAGFNFTSWGLHNIDHASGKDVTSHSTSAGLNMGAGVELRCTSSLKLGLEARYTLMRHYPTAVVCASIAYVF